ncbi:MAG: nucleotidyltransferase domain-containing protein [Oscillospiraceae bacterium]
MMEEILGYIKRTYRPVGIVVYGSFADGSQNAHSDFDALVLTDGGEQTHDTAVVGGTRLDVFVYPAAFFDGPFDCEEFVQLHDGRILLDTDGRAARLQAAVLAYLDAIPPRTAEEDRADADWCEKMLRRAGRGDAEGFFRWHWLLTDSLAIYCGLRRERYFGPKKALHRMRESDPEGYALYERALSSFRYDALADWVAYLRKLPGGQE